MSKPLTDELAAAKEITRELHAAVKDARQAKRDLESTVRAIEAAAHEVEAVWIRIREEIEAKIEAETQSGLGELTDRVTEHIDLFYEAVTHRMEALVDALLGSPGRSTPTIEELILTTPVRPEARKDLSTLAECWKGSRMTLLNEEAVRQAEQFAAEHRENERGA